MHRQKLPEFSLVPENSGRSIHSTGKAHFLSHIGRRFFRRIRGKRKNTTHIFLPGKLQNFFLISGADQEALVRLSSPRCIRKIIDQKDGETKLMRFSYCRKLLETASQDQYLHLSSRFLSLVAEVQIHPSLVRRTLLLITLSKNLEARSNVITSNILFLNVRSILMLSSSAPATLFQNR